MPESAAAPPTEKVKGYDLSLRLAPAADRDDKLGFRGNMIRSFGLRVRLVAVVAVLALAATLGTSVASAAAPPGVNTEGTGPSPKGAGLLSKAALAQDTCTEGGRTNFYYAGNGPFCVNPWA